MEPEQLPSEKPSMSDYDDGASTIRSIPLNIVFAMVIVGVLIAITWSRYKCYKPGSSANPSPNTTQTLQDPFCAVSIDPVPPYMSRESTFVVMEHPARPCQAMTPSDIMRVNTRDSYQSSCVSCNSPVDVHPPPPYPQV